MADHGTVRFDPTADLIDEDGRPVGEIGSRHYDPAATELRTCPYHDARRGHPMNQTALRQLSAVWPEVVAAGAWLARQTTPAGSVHAAWWACIAGTRAPAIHDTLHPGVPVPRALSALYKASLGFSQVLTAVLLADDGIAEAPLASLGDADAFLALLDRERWLVGEQQACAGPGPMIGQLFDAFAGRANEASPGPLAALPPPRSWGDERAAWIGVQVAFLGAARTRATTNAEIDAHLAPGLPCLRGVLAVPGRRAEHARRLFPTAHCPASVRTFLAAQGGCDLASLVALRDAD
ncbi:MAG: hypothetical protein KTR31_40195 [Myxococcales bacterium]|nr:hypothetical protein [Myxococcales bacterium]